LDADRYSDGAVSGQCVVSPGMWEDGTSALRRRWKYDALIAMARVLGLGHGQVVLDWGGTEISFTAMRYGFQAIGPLSWM